MPKKISTPTYKATPRQSESKAIITFEAISSTGYAAVWLGLRADRVDGDEDAEECGAPDERDAVISCLRIEHPLAEDEKRLRGHDGILLSHLRAGVNAVVPAFMVTAVG